MNPVGLFSGAARARLRDIDCDDGECLSGLDHRSPFDVEEKAAVVGFDGLSDLQRRGVVHGIELVADLEERLTAAFDTYVTGDEEGIPLGSLPEYNGTEAWTR